MHTRWMWSPARALCLGALLLVTTPLTALASAAGAAGAASAAPLPPREGRWGS